MIQIPRYSHLLGAMTIPLTLPFDYGDLKLNDLTSKGNGHCSIHLDGRRVWNLSIYVRVVPLDDPRAGTTRGARYLSAHFETEEEAIAWGREQGFKTYSYHNFLTQVKEERTF